MIKIKYDGRLGNKMFMYAIAYILSKKHNQKIESELPKYSCKQNLNCSGIDFDDTIEVNNSNMISIFEQESISSNLHLKDFFQTSEIVKRYKNELKECFTVMENRNQIDGTIIHYRLGDLETLYKDKAAASLAYYEKAISHLGSKKNIYITTDSPEHKNVKYLIKKYDMRLVNTSPEKTIKYGLQFKNKILSLGTFSWWMAFLGNENANIFCPVQNEYFNWAGDIYVFDNWKYISGK